ncbi:Hypothetical Protein FCC1311_011582 [Hondaea fermentalgiana]|uniref:Guanylate cyclase domain-containing protein n=1 Tax=Hondaea fermentalgiana TaxID=2315210 RepID=A0A2R5GA16_9STRA|nr:Hypothetical Protein FCC1311_011582 [Hondaea fermentalgiana]|eukprot:GBG24941.1 Hypothetical Protein FCC1311_011582 [Hondaea fermentalgiana]
MTTINREGTDIEQNSSEVQRLTELAVEQQELILQYAIRDFWSEKALGDVDVDALTSGWLEEHFGDACTRPSSQNLDNGKAFNAVERIMRMRKTFSWKENVARQRDKTETSVERDILEKLDFPSHIEGLDKKALASALDKLEGNDNCLRMLHAMACVLCNLVVYGQHPGAVFISETRALSMMLATLVVRSKRAEAHKEALDFLASSANWMEDLDETAQSEIRETLLWCAAAADPTTHWQISRNLDLLRVLQMDAQVAQAADRPSGESFSAGPSARVFTDVVLRQRILVQGAFRATLHSSVCRPAHIAAEQIANEARTSKTYAGIGQRNSVLVQNLLGLNLADFVVAPLWIPLVHQCPTLQEPVAHLILNRTDWSSHLLSTIEANDAGKSAFEHLRNMVMKRTSAFDNSFGNPRFDPVSLPTIQQQQQQQQQYQRTDTGLSEDAVVRASSVVSLPIRAQSQDFLAQQGKAMNATGATDLFLSLIAAGESREHRIQSSLASTIGFMERTKNVTKYARNDLALQDGSEAKRRDSGHDDGRRNGARTESASVHPNPVTVLPKSFLKKSETDQKLAEEAEQLPRSHHLLRNALDNQVVTTIIAFLTVFALFGDDLKLAAFPKSADTAFGHLTLLTLLVFSAEISSKCVVQPGFKYGFFFWLDVLATVSLIPDIPLIWDAVVASVENFGADADDLTVTRAGRASRAGARAARMLRILRLVRLLRVFKLFEYISMRRERAVRKLQGKSTTATSSRYVAKYLIRKRIQTRKRPSNLSRPVPTGRGQQQSKVGAKLADLTTRRVIIVVLVILFTLPLISLDEVDNSFDASLGMLHMAWVQHVIVRHDQAAFNTTVDNFAHGSPTLMYLRRVNAQNTSEYDIFHGEENADDHLRTAELQVGAGYCTTYNSLSGESPSYSEYVYCSLDISEPANEAHAFEVTEGYFDNSDFERESAWRSICQTIFIIFIFGVATMVFTYDAHKLVIAPIEKMVRIVEELAANPLTTFENDDDSDSEDVNDPTGLLSAGREAYQKRKEAKEKKKRSSTEETYETKLLENSIKKIGGLLQVGFGEAGAEIIASNMNTSGELDPMVPGRKVRAVFGFCSIRNFMMTTEVLGEEIMLYVNEIANIVHTQVSSHSGNANRNMGDSFLVVWKRNPSENESWTQIAEKALISFLKIVVEVFRNQELKNYTSSESTLGSRIQEQLPNFQVRLGFGLHIGWAIEGAIGSNQKIDASYLSPHVNLASKLEEMTRQYGTTIMFSGDYFELLGNDAKICSRKIDEVLLWGNNNPVALYTFDCNLDRLQNRLDAIRLKGDMEEVEEEAVVDRRISLIGPSPIIDHARNIAQIQKSAFRTDLDIRALQWEFPRHFLPLCRKGTAVYLAGHWGEAKTLLEAACKMFPAEEKGPSGQILRFMERYNFVAPSDWPGYRVADKHFLLFA